MFVGAPSSNININEIKFASKDGGSLRKHAIIIFFQIGICDV